VCGVGSTLTGRVRLMTKSEAGGRSFCLELEEGRDISLINPDLLDEARRFVRVVQIGDIERSLRLGVQRRDLAALQRSTAFAAEMKVMVDFELMTAAHTVIAELRQANLLKDLYMASKLLPPAVTEDLLRTADAISLDRNIFSYKLVMLYSQYASEAEKFMVRMAGAIDICDDGMFRRSLRAVSQMSLSDIKFKEKTMLVAALFTYAAQRAFCEVIEEVRLVCYNSARCDMQLSRSMNS
jgi:hypothetical protein